MKRTRMQIRREGSMIKMVNRSRKPNMWLWLDIHFNKIVKRHNTTFDKPNSYWCEPMFRRNHD